MEIAIRATNVTKRFGSEIVLRGVSHDFEAEKIHGIIGNNGSGKSVFFKCVCGFLIPEAGSVEVEGKVIGKDVDFPASLGMIIETPGFLAGASGFKNLKLLASIKGIVDNTRIHNVITEVGLDPDLKKPVGKYSLGMRQRLGIAQALMEHPRILILDEPFNGLDKQGIENMRTLIKKQREEGRTVLMASHNAADIEALCDTVCEMEAGVLASISNPPV